MPTPDYIKKWDVYRDTVSPLSGNKVLIATQDKILTLTTSAQIPSPGSQQNFTVNEDVSWITKASGADRGDYLNLETMGQFRVINVVGQVLTLEYSPLSVAPNNQHATETARAGLRFTQASVRDPDSPNPTFYYQVIGTTDQGQSIPQNVVALSGVAPGTANFLRDIIGANVNVYGLAVDANNNVVIAGTFTFSLNAGGTTMPNATAFNGFVAKYDGQNNFQWSKNFESGVVDTRAKSVAVDSGGNVIVTGFFNGTVQFLSSTGTVEGSLISFSGQDVFVVKYSSSGVFQWAVKFGAGGNDQGVSVAVDSSDNIILLLTFVGSNIDFGEGPIGTGFYNMGIFKMQSDNTLLWTKAYGGSNFPIQPSMVVVDSSDNIFITGTLGVAVDLGSGSNTSSAGIFVGKYLGSTGAYVWAKAFGGTSGNAIAVHPSTGNVYFSGALGGSVSFDGHSVSGGIFVANYTSAGSYVWVTSYGANGSGDTGFGIDIDAGGFLAISGLTGSSIDFEGNGNFETGRGIFAASFTTAGTSLPTHRWHSLGNTGFGSGLMFDSAGHVVVSGSMCTGSVTFGGKSFLAGGSDGLVAQFNK